MPDVEHRHCVKHLSENLKLVFNDLVYKNLLWAVAGAGNKKNWQYHMDKLKEFDVKAYDWLMQRDPSKWARAFFSDATKSDAIQNNICESFNSYIKAARDMPILSMVEWIRRRLMKRIYVKATAMHKYKGEICPNAQESLENKKIESRDCFCTPAGQLKYEVDYGDTRNVVDLYKRTCSCRFWDLTGIPCKHAVSAIWTNREKPEDYVHHYYSKATYLAVYKHLINPVPSKDQWERTNFPDVHPNVVRKPAGRPRKQRIRNPNETTNPYKTSRLGGYVVCGNCKQRGHNVRGCKASITGETSWQRRNRLQQQKGKRKRSYHFAGLFPFE